MSGDRQWGVLSDEALTAIAERAAQRTLSSDADGRNDEATPVALPGNPGTTTFPHWRAVRFEPKT